MPTSTVVSKRRCSRCKKNRPVVDFSKQRSSRTGYHSYCKSCNRDVQREWREKYPKYYRDQQLRWKYGISYDQYLRMLRKQKGVCAVCKKSETALKGHGPNAGEPRELAVDHDHSCCSGQKTCGKCIRGLLCQKCNHALGMVGEDVKVLKRMIQYLRADETAVAIP